MSTATRKIQANTSVSGPFADRTDRFKAALIDAAVLIAANLPVYLTLWMFGIWDFYLVSLILSAGASATIFMTINYNSLKSSGQTFGKKKMNIRIVRRDDQPMDVDELLLKRYAPIWLISLIPVIGPLICLASVLCIFRENNACLHDDLAASKVVPA